jgi:hypothetical protein
VDGQRVVTKISHVIRDRKDRPIVPTKLIKITFNRIVAQPVPPPAPSPSLAPSPQ